jgi:hypothetical protein
MIWLPPQPLKTTAAVAPKNGARFTFDLSVELAMILRVVSGQFWLGNMPWSAMTKFTQE